MGAESDRFSHVDEAGGIRRLTCARGTEPVEVEQDGVAIAASAETTAQTGVEMEALTAATVAALTLYDMAKAIDPAMVVSEVRLLEKTKEPLA